MTEFQLRSVEGQWIPFDDNDGFVLRKNGTLRIRMPVFNGDTLRVEYAEGQKNIRFVESPHDYRIENADTVSVVRTRLTFKLGSVVGDGKFAESVANSLYVTRHTALLIEY